jgi:hypothetical protein
MKKFLALATLLAMSSAHADWRPTVLDRYYTLTINYGGGSRSIMEFETANGPLRSVAEQVVSIPYGLEQGLNTYVAQLVNSNGAHFLQGHLSGSINASIRPQSSGVTYLGLNGFSYYALSSYSGSKFGILNYTCQNQLYLNNVSVTAQYGSVNGALGSNVGLTFSPTSSTDCDTNLGWIIPGVDRLVNSVATKVDAGIEATLLNSAAKVKDSLFFARDQNFLVGLNKLVPADTVIALPGGGTFALGQYVQNNLAYLLANSQINAKIDRGAVVDNVVGNDFPGADITGNVITLAVTTPGTSFSVQLQQTSDIRWNWVCNIAQPQAVCEQP